jgi:hypothetical protein
MFGKVVAIVYGYGNLYDTVDHSFSYSTGSPSKSLKAIDQDNNITYDYWKWRDSVYRFPQPIRYPNGYHHRHECLGLLWKTQQGWVNYDYITARKEVYVKLYQESLVKTGVVSLLKNLIKGAGITEVVIYERDVPSIRYSNDVYEEFLNNSGTPFGHGWVLAKLLIS